MITLDMYIFVVFCLKCCYYINIFLKFIPLLNYFSTRMDFFSFSVISVSLLTTYFAVNIAYVVKPYPRSGCF